MAALEPLAEPGAEKRVKRNTDTKDSVMVADPEPEPRYVLFITQLVTLHNNFCVFETQSQPR